MKLRKNKIVFVLVLVCVVLFITVYAILTFGKDKKENLEPQRIPLPDLKGNQVEYTSKLEAIEAIKEERETTAPQLYPDHMVDDKGYFNPDYMEYEKQRIIDSVQQARPYKYDKPLIVRSAENTAAREESDSSSQDSPSIPMAMHTHTEELGSEHQVFFAPGPEPDQGVIRGGILALIDGKQTVREGHRLELRLGSAAFINGTDIPENSRIYGFVKIRPNRLLVEISNIGDLPVVLKVHDLQDGREGLYVENHLVGGLVNQSVDNGIEQINIPGVPQLRGLKGIFHKDNRAIKVEIPNNYRLTLKP